MAGKNTADVFKLLASLSKVDEDKIGVLDAEKIKATDPDSHLIHRWEPDFMDGYELKTPSGHVIHVQNIWDAYVAGENILLTGPSGCGKSTIAFHILDEANEKIRANNRLVYQENLELLKQGKEKEDLVPYSPLPYEISHCSCHEGSRSEHLIGTVTVKVNPDGSREPVVVRGAVTDAWVGGKTLILEEMDFAPPGVWGECHQFFDGRTRETMIYINGPEKIKKHQRFRVIATANTLGAGENQVEFAGTQVLNRAFMNRFTYIIHVDWMKPECEINLIMGKTGLRKDIVQKMIEAATQTRASHKEGVVDTAITTRDTLSWARECKRYETRMKKEGTDCSTLDIRAYWSNIVVPSAHPTFLNRIADQNTLETFDRFLAIR